MLDGTRRQPSIAVIIPVYNVEKYLSACLDSVREQDYPEWTATIVIDGSPDGSEAIARRYADEDARFEVVVVPNGGLGSARNVGIEHSRGHYVFFLDSDDTLPPGTLGALASAAASSGSEIVAGFAEDFGADYLVPTRYWTQTGSLFDDESTFAARQRPDFLADHVVWNKLYARTLLESNGIDFPPRVHCEDMVFSARAALLADSITVVPRLVYRHRRHDEAISASYTRSKTLADWLGQSELAIRAIERLGDESTLGDYLLNFMHVQWWTRARNLHEITDDALMSGLQELSRLILDVMPSQARRRLSRARMAVLEFYAYDEPRRLHLSSDETPSPLDEDFGRVPTEAREVLTLARELAGGGRVSRELAQVLVVERVLRPIADGHHWPEDGFLDDVLEVVAVTGTDYLESLTGPHGSTSERLHRFVDRHGTGRADIDVLRHRPGALVLRGGAEHTRGSLEAETIELQLQPKAGGAPVVVPATRTSHEPGRLRWSAVVPQERLSEGVYSAALLLWDQAAGRGRLLAAPSASLPLELHGPARSLSLRHALRDLDGPKRRLFTFPAWRDNPFVTLLQLEAVARGYAIAGTSELGLLVEELTDPARHGVVHIQWPSAITDGAISPANAESRVDVFLTALRTAKALRRPIVWTVHNALPHDTAFRNAALRLHQGIADLADAIHVLNSRTADVVADEYVLPADRIVVIPHAAYTGVYGPAMARTDARADIAAPAQDVGVLFFGQIRPYKGLEQLLDAMRAAARRDPALRLLLAGRPVAGGEEVVAGLDRTAVPSTEAVRFIEDAEVPAWFSAADVLVLPYRRILNSGTMHLAAAFGVPVIMPDEPHLRADFGDEPWIRFFDPTEPAASIAELLLDRWYLAGEARNAALDFAHRRLPIDMSRAFARLLDELSA